MTQELEIWKDIEGFEGLYAVSNLGNVHSYEKHHRSGFNRNGITKRRATNLKPRLDKDGYVQVSLHKGKYYTKKVHRLVASAFIPNPDNLPTVNHIDGVKVNNNISNLEWMSRSDNTKHAYRTGLMQVDKEKIGRMVARAKLKGGKRVEVFSSTTGELLSVETDMRNASDKYTVKLHILRDISRGRRKRNIVGDYLFKMAS